MSVAYLKVGTYEKLVMAVTVRVSRFERSTRRPGDTPHDSRHRSHREARPSRHRGAARRRSPPARSASRPEPGEGRRPRRARRPGAPKADYSQPETLGPAFAGRRRCCSSPPMRSVASGSAAPGGGGGGEEGRRAARLRSVLHAETLRRMSLAGEHKATERLIRASGLPFVFLRNGWYIENYTENLGPRWRTARSWAARRTAASRRRPGGLRGGRGGGAHRLGAREQGVRAGG